MSQIASFYLLKEGRRQELLGLLLQGLAHYREAVRQEALLVTGKLLFESPILDMEEKARLFALCYRKLLFLTQETTGHSGLTFFYRAAALAHINRFIALRFMEVNGYLPSHVRVFTDEANQFKPQILAEAIHMELDGLDMQKVYACKNANDDDGLFKYMIIVQCNALSSILPGMFQRISDYLSLIHI